MTALESLSPDMARANARRVNAAIDRRRHERRRAAATARYVAELHARAAAIDCPAADALRRRRAAREADRAAAMRTHAAGVAVDIIATALARPPDVIARWVAADTAPVTTAADVVKVSQAALPPRPKLKDRPTRCARRPVSMSQGSKAADSHVET